MSMNRREFLQDSALAAAVAASGILTQPLTAADQASPSKGDKLRVAVIGVKGRGRDHISGFAGKHNCEVAIICDADSAVIGPAMQAATKAQGSEPKFVQDLRRVMDDKSIDIVSIATPNHWHALSAIWALQAGKDVYVEKPVSHNVSEGRRIVEAARKYNKICQTGTQSRSMNGMKQSIALVQSGKLGKVKLARGLCYKPRGSIGKVDGPQQVPESCDYNLWCGPAPLKPLMRQRLHYDWHWTWDYGNGDLGNQGIHEMDKARWGLGKEGLPQSVISLGGRFGYVDDGETANTQICVFDYGTAPLIFEVRGLKTDPLRGARIGNIFYCEQGVVVCPTYSSGIAYTNDGQEIQRFSGGGDHYGNFVQAVRERNPKLLAADIEEGHLSSALCHLGNISYLLGRVEANPNPAAIFGSDKDGLEALERMLVHLKENGVSFDSKTGLRVGRKLALDSQTETFVSDPEADRLLTREYRKGFEVPARL
ncbi:MAG: Gfo/Idh/MocA family protein [Gemmataceae bacterium]